MQINVMHLDDSQEERKLVLDKLLFFSKYIFLVESFSTSNDLLGRLKLGPLPNVVVLDIHLEGELIDGIVVAKKCRDLSETLLIVMRSSLTGINIRNAAFKNGANAFVGKGQGIGQLAEKIAELLELNLQVMS